MGPRPSVATLMQQAIDRSAQQRAEQEAVAASNITPPMELVSASEPAQLDPHVMATQLDETLAEATDGVLLNEELVETDVREAVTLIATTAGADVLMDDKVRGVVNITLVDATFEQALDKLLLPLGYVYGRRGEQYVIAPPDPKSPLFPYISSQVEYRPKNLKAKDLMAAPPQQMVPFVRLVETNNLLVIEAPTQFMPIILERLEALDQPVPQVELEAIVCVVSPDCGFRFGLDWSHAVELNDESAFKLGVTGLGIEAVGSKRGYEGLFDDFATTSAFVKLLAQNGYLTIRASPRVMAQDGGDANISIARETFFSTQVSPSVGSNTNNSAFFYQPNIQKVESGITLDITPRIRGDEVTVEIKNAEVSEDIRSASADLAANPYPIITRRKVSTTVHVRDGKTIIIGGLVQRETIDRTSRIPGLSNLPGVGNLFKSVEKQSRDAEVVIFISPRIVQPQPDFPVVCEEPTANVTR